MSDMGMNPNLNYAQDKTAKGLLNHYLCKNLQRVEIIDYYILMKIQKEQ